MVFVLVCVTVGAPNIMAFIVLVRLSVVVPRVARVVDLLVCPRVRKKDFSCIGLQVCKCIEYMSVYLLEY